MLRIRVGIAGLCGSPQPLHRCLRIFLGCRTLFRKTFLTQIFQIRDKTYRDTTIHVQDEICLFGSRHHLHAKGKIEHLGGTELRQCIVSNTVHTLVWIRLTLMRWPTPIIRILFFLKPFTNCLCDTPASAAFVNIFAASSNAPPKRGPMQSKPEHKIEIKSLPAQDATTVLCAPDTAGP